VVSTQRKICLLGPNAVGKTSLVRRFVESIFSERYQATIGVKIDRKVVVVDAVETNLVIWDLQGADDLARVRTSYLRGAAGVLLVADGTRPETLKAVSLIQTHALQSLGHTPTVLLLNKCDLADEWRADDASLRAFDLSGLPTVRSSAKTGEGVDEGFHTLVRQMAKG
jgi:small GTP-binding protein